MSDSGGIPSCRFIKRCTTKRTGRSQQLFEFTEKILSAGISKTFITPNYLSSKTQGQSVGSGEKAGCKFSSMPVLENLRTAISPDTDDCPWVSEDANYPVKGIYLNIHKHAVSSRVLSLA